MSDELTPAALRRAGEQAEQLDVLLDRCMEEKLLPLLIGFDLPYLAEKFIEAAATLEDRQ